MNTKVSRRDIAMMASEGLYDMARDTALERQRCFALEQEARRQKLLERQELEYKTFQDAKRQQKINQRVLAEVKKLDAKEALHRRYGEVCDAHEEELDVFRSRVVREESRRPIAWSTIFARMRSAEVTLAKAGEYDASARTHAALRAREPYELEAAEEQRRRAAVRRIHDKENNLELRGVSTYRNMIVAQELSEKRADTAFRTAEANLRFRESEMAAAHRSQRRALALPLLEPRAFSKAQQQRASRGTLLSKRVHGNHYCVPSLCDMYRDYIE